MIAAENNREIDEEHFGALVPYLPAGAEAGRVYDAIARRRPGVDPKTVIDRATFEQPNQYPVGINFVIVNGQIEVDSGQRTPALAGRVLRGPGYR